MTPDELLGRWRLTHASLDLELEPNTEMVFHDDGRLIYSIPDAVKTSVMRLTYRVEGDVIVSDQPSSPREERTRFALDGDRLTLDYDGSVAEFQRIKASAPRHVG